MKVVHVRRPKGLKVKNDWTRYGDRTEKVNIHKHRATHTHTHTHTQVKAPLLKNIRIAFAFLNEDTMRKIITSMICLRLEYAAIIWSLHELEHIRKLERIQRAAMKMIPELQDQSNEERLATLQLPTLEKMGKKEIWLHCTDWWMEWNS